MNSLPLDEAVIFSRREALLAVLRQELKNVGLDPASVHCVNDLASCLDAIAEDAPRILIFDWDVGPGDVLSALATNLEMGHTHSHPSILLASQWDKRLLSAAAEYGVSNISAGDLSQPMIRSRINEIMTATRNLSPIKTFLLQVEQLMNKGRTKDAELLLRQLRQKLPGNPIVELELASVLVQSKNWDEAESLLAPLQKSDPPLPRACHLMARCRLQKKDSRGAIAALKNAQLGNPLSLDRLKSLGDLFLSIGQPGEAKKSFGDLLKLAPNDADGRIGKAASMVMLEEVNEALEILKGPSHRRELAAAFNMAAIFAIHQKNFITGVHTYNLAISLLGDIDNLAARLYFNLGIGMVKWGKLAEALQAFDKSCALDPTFADAQKNAKIVSARIKSGGNAAAMKPDELSGMEESFGSTVPYASPTLSKLADLEEDIGISAAEIQEDDDDSDKFL